MAPSKTKHDEVSIVLCGEAGMGIQTVAQILVQSLARAGFHCSSTQEVMSRIRGGQNSTSVRVGCRPVPACVDRVDLLLPLNPGALDHVRHRLTSATRILFDPEKVPVTETESFAHACEAPLTALAKENGPAIMANVVAVGLIGALLEVDEVHAAETVRQQFDAKGDEVVNANLRALEAGAVVGRRMAGEIALGADLQPDPAADGRILMSGIEAIGLGAMAGGCNFMAAYPMSPSTGLLTFLARHAERFGVVVEQAEDEIAAINMALGAWYAGARAVTSTSGGGFALMSEGLSLAGMIESPLVIHLAQRPGPATGLPTRTEQGDLDLAIYAGHGEFPRAIFAPGNVQQAYTLTAQAFSLADRTQTPVLILSDQYLVDTAVTHPPLQPPTRLTDPAFIETQTPYQRYALTADGISPRGIPGHGDGLVIVDSDEHDEEGHITEDLEWRTRMVDKRLAKGRALAQAVLAPTLWPRRDYRRLVVCWGSTLPIVQAALEAWNDDRLSLLHFAQVHPLHPQTLDYLQQAEQVLFLEGNAGGQFEALVRRETGWSGGRHWRRYDGLNFSVEHVLRGLQQQFG